MSKHHLRRRLTSLRENLVRIGAKGVRHDRSPAWGWDVAPRLSGNPAVCYRLRRSLSGKCRTDMIGLDILREYLSRVFIEVKQRPLYLVRERVGFGADQRADAPAGI